MDSAATAELMAEGMDEDGAGGGIRGMDEEDFDEDDEEGGGGVGGVGAAAERAAAGLLEALTARRGGGLAAGSGAVLQVATLGSCNCSKKSWKLVQLLEEELPLPPPLAVLVGPGLP